MSRGPGRIERVILAAFEAHPDRRFTTNDLVARAYPGTEHPTKAQRVAVLRAADKVAAEMGWVRSRDRPGRRKSGSIVTYRTPALITAENAADKATLAALTSQ